jgi:hypothetical protein
MDLEEAEMRQHILDYDEENGVERNLDGFLEFVCVQRGGTPLSGRLFQLQCHVKVMGITDVTQFLHRLQEIQQDYNAWLLANPVRGQPAEVAWIMKNDEKEMYLEYGWIWIDIFRIV